MGSLLQGIQAVRIIMPNFLSFLLVTVVVVLLCNASHGVGGSEAVGPVLSLLESEINQLEEKYNSLSGRSCEDGEMGKDGDCANICSKDRFLTYENKVTRSGRVACCRDGEKVSPSGGCQKVKIPDFCSRLKGRLVDVPNPPIVVGGPLQAGQFFFLRGFELLKLVAIW